MAESRITASSTPPTRPMIMAMIVSSMVTTTPRSTNGAKRVSPMYPMSTWALCHSDHSSAKRKKMMTAALIQRP